MCLCVYIYMFLIIKNFVEVYLIYSVLISTVYQSDSVIHIYTFFSYSSPLWFITGFFFKDHTQGIWKFLVKWEP